jgi:hypothetical protein
MPQPDASGAKDWGVAMKKGEVNLINPVKADAKESVNKRLDSMLTNTIIKVKK